jgi:hypothetical protein
MFPFLAGSPLLHQWHIQDLLPVKCTTRKILKLWNSVRRNLFHSHQAAANRSIDNQGRIPQTFKVGNLVFCKKYPLSHVARKVSAKLSPRWCGPFLTDSFLTSVTAKLIDPASGDFVTRAHLSQMEITHS